MIGVAEPKGSSGFGGDSDDVIIVPVSTYRAKLQGGLQQFIDGTVFLGATSQEATAQAEQDVTRSCGPDTGSAKATRRTSRSVTSPTSPARSRRAPTR